MLDRTEYRTVISFLQLQEKSPTNDLQRDISCVREKFLTCETVKQWKRDNTFKYHVFAPMERFQLELIYLYFPPSFYQTVVVSVL